MLPSEPVILPIMLSLPEIPDLFIYFIYLYYYSGSPFLPGYFSTFLLVLGQTITLLQKPYPG